MEFLAICSKGLEESLIWEAKGYGLKLVEKSDYIVVLKGNLENFSKFTYFTQIAKNCLIYNNKYKNIEDIDSVETNKEILNLIEEGETFKVKIDIPIKSKKNLCQPLSMKYGEYILGIAKENNRKISVELKTPDKMIYGLYNGTYLYLGSLVNKKPLDTRDYRLFLTNTSLKSNIAFWSWVNIASVLKKDYKSFKKYLLDKRILDLSCSTGEIGIEMTMYLNSISHNKYRTREIFFKWFKSNIGDYTEDLIDNKLILSDNLLKELNFAKKNSKVIEVNDFIDFTRTAVDYLDVKFEENDISIVNSKIFQPGAYEDPKKYNEKYKELFYQLDYILDKKGLISFVFNKKELKELLLEKSKEYKFKLINKYESYLGEQKYYQYVFGR